MNHNSKTKEQLITELIELQKTIVDQEKIGSEYKKVEEALQKALEYSEGIVETVREPLVILDIDLKVITANRSFYQAFQVSRDETEGQYIYDIGNQQWNVPELRALLLDILPKKTIIDDFVVQHDFPIIGYRIMCLNAREVLDHEKRKNILLAIEDITERRKAEGKIETSLKEKEMLLREIHHRVKNNMMVITSLLRLQGNRIEDEHYKEMFNDSINRIKSMLRIHEQLYRSEDLANVDFNDYIKAMINRMFSPKRLH
jgi:PAS domain S-box-containing protein